MILFTKLKRNSRQEQNIKSKMLSIVIFYAFRGIDKNYTDIKIMLNNLRLKETELY